MKLQYDTFQLVHQVEDQAPDDTCSDMHSVHQYQAPTDHIKKKRKWKPKDLKKKSISRGKVV